MPRTIKHRIEQLELGAWGKAPSVLLLYPRVEESDERALRRAVRDDGVNMKAYNVFIYIRGVQPKRREVAI